MGWDGMGSDEMRYDARSHCLSLHWASMGGLSLDPRLSSFHLPPRGRIGLVLFCPADKKRSWVDEMGFDEFNAICVQRFFIFLSSLAGLPRVRVQDGDGA